MAEDKDPADAIRNLQRIEAHPDDPADTMFHWSDGQGNRMTRVRNASHEVAEAPDPKTTLAFWTITRSAPGDPYPFVARRLDFDLEKKEQRLTSDVRVGSTIDEVRDQLPLGLTNIGRMAEDLPQIVETWI